MTGRLFSVVGPSGAGKDTLLAGVCAAPGGPYWVRRVITRPESAGGEPYEGVTVQEFARREGQGEFALVWRAHGLAYGIPRAELAALASGRDVVFNGSRKAMAQAAAAFPGLRVIHVTAPPDVLAERLAARGREEAGDVAARLAREVEPFPEGLPVTEVLNHTTPAEGIARLAAAFQERNQDRGLR
ncbi:MAG: phosphonate metabolism protein/1,5-bisphosphokinase (PRPP-forming) PhnN [Pararhodobacter sp.]